MKTLGSILGMILTGCQMQAPEPARAASVAQPATAQENKPMTRMVTSKDGTRIAFDKTGSGPALIIVSGALSHRKLLGDNPLLPMLAKDFTLIVYDRRGRGESTDVQPYAVDREIEDLDALIEDAGGSAALYGVSSGAALALQAAAKLGAKTATKVAVYDAPYGQKPQDFATQKQRINEIVRTKSPGDAAAFFFSAIGTPPEAIEQMKKSPQWNAIAAMDFTLAYDYEVLGDGAVPEDVVKSIRVPALVMNGGSSMPFMAASADRMAELIPNAQRRTLEGQSHQAAPDVIAPVLIEFFRP